MISRRALFGLSVGAVVASVSKPTAAAPVVIGMDFGKKPAMVFANGWVIHLDPQPPRLVNDSAFRSVERVG